MDIARTTPTLLQDYGIAAFSKAATHCQKYCIVSMCLAFIWAVATVNIVKCTLYRVG